MRRYAVLSPLALLAALGAAAGTAQAQGFGVYEHDACVMGRSGTAVASPCSGGSAIFFNPAGILADGPRWHAQIGATLISPRGGFTDSATGSTTDATPNNIPVPSFFITRQVGSRLAIGVGVNAPYGLVSEWPNTFAGRFLAYRADLASIYVQPTVALKLGSRIQLGAGVTFVHSTVELRQRVDLSSQVASASTGTTFGMLGIPEGTDFADAMLEGSGSGTGAHFGVLVRLSDRLSLGARYLTEVTIDYDGEVSFSQWPTGIVLAAGNPFGVPRNTPLDAVLRSSFNTTLATQGATASIVMPSQVVVGVALKLRENLILLGDYQRVGWDAFAELPLDFAELGPDTLYEDYEATSGWRAGFEYVRSPRVTLRGGMLYHGAAAPAQTVTPLLPEGARIEGTVGLGLKVSRIARLDLAYQYIRQQDRRGRVTEAPVRGPDGADANSGLYTSTAKLFGASLAFAF